ALLAAVLAGAVLPVAAGAWHLADTLKAAIKIEATIKRLKSFILFLLVGFLRPNCTLISRIVSGSGRAGAAKQNRRSAYHEIASVHRGKCDVALPLMRNRLDRR